MALSPVVLASGRVIDFDVRMDCDGPAQFLLSVRKCGSSIFNNIARALVKANNRHYIDVGGTFFRTNVPTREYMDDNGVLALIRGGNVYGGFRDMPKVLLRSPLFQSGPKLLMIRYPRDMLVSQYFSNAYSHPIPAATAGHAEVTRHMERQRAQALRMGLDDYVIRHAEHMNHSMMLYQPVVANAQTTVLKYENYIFDKRSLMLVMAEKFGWRVDDELIRLILEWADVRPEQESPTAFVRKVTPGDHREKLASQTISAINTILKPAMAMFRYAT